MKIVMFGATGGSGKAAVAAGLAVGHEMTAFARNGAGLRATFPGLRVVEGDALDSASVAAALQGQDAAIIALGISENALRVRLRGSSTTPMDIRSRGTAIILDEMRKAGVKRLVAQTSYGVGETQKRLGLVDRAIFAALLKPQIADTERQETVIRASGLDWVLVQPVHLTDEPAEGLPHASTTGETPARKVSREQVGRFLIEALGDDSYTRRTVALSGT
jgi:putative NADH-flavin reductase